MKVPEDKTVPTRVGWVVRKQCGGWRAGVDCGFGDIREGCNCTGHVAVWDLATLRSVPCSPRKKEKKKKRAFEQTVCGMSVGFSK